MTNMIQSPTGELHRPSSAASIRSERVEISANDLELLLQATEPFARGADDSIPESLRKDLAMAHERVRQVSRRSRPRSPTGMPSPRLNFRSLHHNNSPSSGFAPIRPNQRLSIPPALGSPSKAIRKKSKSKAGVEMSGYMDLDLTNRKELDEYYENRFTQLQQLNCKEIAKAWIKAIEPKKQSQFPYNSKQSNKGKRPPWWPEKCAYVEPDHLKKPDRVRLLVSMLHLRIKPISVYEKATRDVPNRMQHPENALPLLEELYMVAKAAERLYHEGDACPQKTVKIGRSAEAVRNAKKLKDEQQMYLQRIVEQQMNNVQAQGNIFPVSPPETPSQSMTPSPPPHHSLPIRESMHYQPSPPSYVNPSQHMYSSLVGNNMNWSHEIDSQGRQRLDTTGYAHSPHAQHSPTSDSEVYVSEAPTSVVTPSTGGFPHQFMDAGMPSSSAEDYHPVYATNSGVVSHGGYDVAPQAMHPHVSHGADY